MSVNSGEGIVSDGHGNEHGVGGVQVFQGGDKPNAGIVSDGHGNEHGVGGVQVFQGGDKPNAGIVSDGHGNEHGVGGVQVLQGGGNSGAGMVSNGYGNAPGVGSTNNPPNGSKPAEAAPGGDNKYERQGAALPSGPSGHGRFAGMSAHHSKHPSHDTLKNLHNTVEHTHGAARVAAIKAEQGALGIKQTGFEGKMTQAALRRHHIGHTMG